MTVHLEPAVAKKAKVAKRERAKKHVAGKRSGRPGRGTNMEVQQSVSCAIFFPVLLQLVATTTILPSWLWRQWERPTRREQNSQMYYKPQLTLRLHESLERRQDMPVWCDTQGHSLH